MVLVAFALYTSADAATIATFPVDPMYTAAPFSGMESLVVDPVATSAALVPDTSALTPDVERLRSEAKAPDAGLVFTNPTNTWTWLAINGERIGTIGPFASARFDGLKPGRYRIDLTLPNGFVRRFAVQTHVPIVDQPGTLAPVGATLQADRIQLSERLFFDADSAALQPVSLPWLDAAAALLLAHPEVLKVDCEGNTDDRGDAVYNQALSASRAKSVYDGLITRGVSADRLTFVGFGESRPVDPADNEDAWRRNRRVELVITSRAPEPAPTVAPVKPAGSKAAPAAKPRK